MELAKYMLGENLYSITLSLTKAHLHYKISFLVATTWIRMF